VLVCPDEMASVLLLVLLRRIGGEYAAPELYDVQCQNIQCWADEDPVNGTEASRAAFNLADAIRGVLWRAFRTQQVVEGYGWIISVREASAPQEIPDEALPHLGRYSATYELRVRPAA